MNREKQKLYWSEPDFLISLVYLTVSRILHNYLIWILAKNVFARTSQLSNEVNCVFVNTRSSLNHFYTSESCYTLCK